MLVNSLSHIICPSCVVRMAVLSNLRDVLDRLDLRQNKMEAQLRQVQKGGGNGESGHGYDEAAAAQHISNGSAGGSSALDANDLADLRAMEEVDIPFSVDFFFLISFFPCRAEFEFTRSQC